MKKAKTLIKILVLISFFLPSTFIYVSCDGLGLNVAYNRNDAEQLIKQQLDTSIAVSYDSVSYNPIPCDSVADFEIIGTSIYANHIADSLIKNDQTFKARSSRIFNKAISKIFFPSERSISSFGVLLYYKDLLGRIFVLVPLLISIIFLFEKKIKLIRENTGSLYLTCSILIMIFIIYSISQNVGLEFGIWTMLFLNITGLIINPKKRKPVGNLI